MKLNKNMGEAARDYAAVIAEAARRLKIDPELAIENTDDYPALCKVWMVEFSIGWLRGVADARGVDVVDLWRLFQPAKAPKAPNRRKVA